jgi:diguanylate cyclase (GGDEF)-like protein
VIAALTAVVLAAAAASSLTAVVLRIRHRRRLAALRCLLDRDPLTGVASRSALDTVLDAADPTSTAVLFVDLDGFKQVNDTYGHDVGDALLVAVAGRLSRVVRAGDVVGRRGGDEFLVVCRLNRGDDPHAIADRVLGCFGAPFAVPGHELPLTASIGVATTARGDGEDMASLLRAADLAMYRAKRTQRAALAMAS